MNTYLDQLALRLQTARDAYYNGKPVMTDAQYDALEDELRKADPNHPILKKVGAAPVGGSWPKVRHEIPMGSLNKAQVEDEMKSWFRGVWRVGEAVAVMDKLDGASIELIYEKRHLVRGVTRGDGIEGDDITRNVLLMQGAVKILPPTINGQPTPDKVFVRGEVVVTKSDFAAHFHGESNPRNTANGTMKRQTGHEKCQYLTIITYQFMPNGMGLETKSKELDILKSLGFHTPRWAVCKSEQEIENIYQAYVASIRDSLNYLIDGLVLELDDRDKRDAFGDLNGKPKAAVAYKFPHDSKPTTLRNVRWQVGNSGRVTPVAEFDTVNLAGANVANSDLHTVRIMADLVDAARPGQKILCVGDSILVSRRNDVIPYVEALLATGDTSKPLPIPTICPVCGASLSMNGEYLVCKNEDGCEAQVTGMIKRWVKKVEILHLGDTIIDVMAEEGLVNDIADLYLVDPVKVSTLDMGGRLVGGTADRGFKNLHAKKTLPLHVLVGSLGIPLIGRSMAKTIVDAGFDSLSKMYKAHTADIAAIPGVGFGKAEAFTKGLKKKMGLIAKLIGEAGIQIATNDGALKGKSFCMTGFRDSTLSDAIERQGGTMKSGVSKGLDYLIAQDPNSNSGKAQKAKQYGTKVIGIDEAKKMAGM